MTAVDKNQKHQSLILARLKGLRQLMNESGVEALLISSDTNRRYFSGFEARDYQMNESSGVLLITPRAQILLTDSRYTLEAESQAPLFKILEYRQGLGAKLAQILQIKRSKQLAIEPEFMSLGTLTRLEEALPHLEFTTLPFDLSRQRASKSPEEIKLIRKALKITEEALGNAWDMLKPGLTEREVAFFLESEFRRLGAEGPSFETIMASGPNGALPHACPGSKKIKTGETVIIDCGARYNGYCADITRTKIIGRPHKWQKEIYTVVHQAQKMAIAAIAPGKVASEVDRVARDYIKSQGFGDYFGHGLGHGVGLAVHESPSLSPHNSRPLVEGEIITVEPGIYLPGLGGVRLEQMVLVTEKGHRVLNQDRNLYSDW